MDGFQVLLDSPDTAVKRFQIAKLGKFKDKRYGDFSITGEDVKDWQRNLAALPGNRALIDEDHLADKTPRRTEASGWITGVDLDGDKVMADIEWTSKGRDAIADKRYLFFSPSYGPHRDETGTTHANTLIGGALTNRPFLSMPALMLASDERVSEAIREDPAARFYVRALDGELGEETRALVMLDVSQAERDKAHAAGNSLPDKSYPINNVAQLKAAATLASSGHGDVAAAKKLIRRRAKELDVDVTTLPGFGTKALDSRRTMDKALLTALGLDSDTDALTALEGIELDEATSKKLLDAAAALKAKAEKPEPEAETRTLDQLAQDEGKVLLDADSLKTLQSQAADGYAAKQQLHQERFDHAFEAALTNRDGAKVRPAEREQLQHFYTLDADATLKLIDDREPITHGRPSGDPAIELDRDDVDDQTLLENGIDPAGRKLERDIRAEMKDKNLPESDYPRLLAQRMGA